jgi:hypothetical protein
MEKQNYIVMKKYLLLLFSLLLLAACTKNLQVSNTKAPVYSTKQPKFPVLALQPKTVISPVVVQLLPTTKIVLSSINIYEQAYYQIRQMLQGGKPLSFKQAVYLTENAYFEDELPERVFNQAIAELVTLTKAVEKTSTFKHKYEDSTNLWKNYAIYRVLADTLTIANIFQLLPYQYDETDSRGEKEWTTGFVTKLLATKKGNCHSLPYLYKILCDELGAAAHLALAPNHLYIKHHSKKTGWYNTELTSATFPIDAWLMTSGYVSLEAVQNAVYMDTIGTYRAVALCLVDLGQGFAKKYPENDGTFVLQCCDLALKHFPTCINAMLLKAETLFAQHKKLVKEKGKDDPETKAKFAEMNQVYKQIYQSGYRQMPKQMYINWLLDLKENKDKYIKKKVAVFKK